MFISNLVDLCMLTKRVGCLAVGRGDYSEKGRDGESERGEGKDERKGRMLEARLMGREGKKNVAISQRG